MRKHKQKNTRYKTEGKKKAEEVKRKKKKS